MRLPLPALLARIALAVALAILALRAGDVLRAAAAAIGFTLNLDYGEGIVLQQALLVTGPRAYGDITQFPFIVFHYPPGYLLAVRAVAALGVDLVAAGRLVSCAGTLAAAAAIGAMVHAALGGASRGVRLFGAATGGLLLFAFWPVARWMPLARVDMLALALTLWGLVLAIQAPEARWRPYAAAALFTAAVFTRQTMLAAPAAATLVLLIASPRDALRLVAAGLLMSLALLVAGTLLTEGGFLRHLILYNINRYDHRGFWMLHRFAVDHAAPIALGLAGAAAVLAMLRPRLRGLPAALRADPALRAAAAALLHAGISTPLLLLIAKSGASVNYVIEWSAGCAMLAGLLAGRAAQAGAMHGAGRLAAGGAMAVATLLAAHALTLRDPAHGILSHPAVARGAMQQAVALVRAANRPVLSEDMVLLLRAGQEVPWEPAIFAELASLGRWDERLIVEAIRGGRFAFAVTLADRGDPIFDSRYNPAVASALEAAFPRRVQLGWLLIRLPADSTWVPTP